MKLFLLWIIFWINSCISQSLYKRGFADTTTDPPPHVQSAFNDRISTLPLLQQEQIAMQEFNDFPTLMNALKTLSVSQKLTTKILIGPHPSIIKGIPEILHHLLLHSEHIDTLKFILDVPRLVDWESLDSPRGKYILSLNQWNQIMGLHSKIPSNSAIKCQVVVEFLLSQQSAILASSQKPVISHILSNIWRWSIVSHAYNTLRLLINRDEFMSRIAPQDITRGILFLGKSPQVSLVRAFLQTRFQGLLSQEDAFVLLDNALHSAHGLDMARFLVTEESIMVKITPTAYMVLVNHVCDPVIFPALQILLTHPLAPTHLSQHTIRSALRTVTHGPKSKEGEPLAQIFIHTPFLMDALTNTDVEMLFIVSVEESWTEIMDHILETGQLRDKVSRATFSHMLLARMSRQSPSSTMALLSRPWYMMQLSNDERQSLLVHAAKSHQLEILQFLLSDRTLMTSITPQVLGETLRSGAHTPIIHQFSAQERSKTEQIVKLFLGDEWRSRIPTKDWMATLQRLVSQNQLESALQILEKDDIATQLSRSQLKTLVSLDSSPFQKRLGQLIASKPTTLFNRLFWV